MHKWTSAYGYDNENDAIRSIDKREKRCVDLIGVTYLGRSGKVKSSIKLRTVGPSLGAGE